MFFVCFLDESIGLVSHSFVRFVTLLSLFVRWCLMNCCRHFRSTGFIRRCCLFCHYHCIEGLTWWWLPMEWVVGRHARFTCHNSFHAPVSSSRRYVTQSTLTELLMKMTSAKGKLNLWYTVPDLIKKLLYLWHFDIVRTPCSYSSEMESENKYLHLSCLERWHSICLT
jgi:hypothetical protein